MDFAQIANYCNNPNRNGENSALINAVNGADTGLPNDIYFVVYQRFRTTQTPAPVQILEDEKIILIPQARVAQYNAASQADKDKFSQVSVLAAVAASTDTLLRSFLYHFEQQYPSIFP